MSQKKKVKKDKKDSFDWNSLKLAHEYSSRVTSAREIGDFLDLREVSSHVGKEVNLNGWVTGIRSSGKIAFMQIRDVSGKDIQGVVEEKKVEKRVWDSVKELTIESALQVKGEITKHPKKSDVYEIGVMDIKIIQKSPEYPIGRKEHGVDFLLENRHLWLRSSKQRAVLRIRDEIMFSMMVFLREEGFVRVDTPIFQPTSCEDTSELFKVDYFGEQTYLTQSGQLYCEAAEFALGKTYDFGPVFRAEKSKTRKHLIEFWMMDAELPFTDLDGLMDFEEKMIKYIMNSCLKNCKSELETLERDVSVLQKYVDSDFIRMTHPDTIDLLNKKFSLKLSYMDDIGAPEEAKLSELFDLPVFVSMWPAEIKAFYMTKEEKVGKDKIERVRAVDLIAAEGYGEITGGSEREFDYNTLLDIMKEHGYNYEDYKWYLDLRKYGSIPHSGFGIGVERFVRWICGARHIRETILFPRMLGRMHP